MSRLREIEANIELTGEWLKYCGSDNFLREGATFICEDSYECGHWVISIIPEICGDENKILIDECFVDPLADWIDMGSVKKLTGVSENASLDDKAVAVYTYYGTEKFNGERKVKDIEEVVEQLRERGVIV